VPVKLPADEQHAHSQQNDLNCYGGSHLFFGRRIGRPFIVCGASVMRFVFGR
jgi:hypothetical protein